jgi:uncharacterized peroxidase-related enzyme
MKKVTVPGYEQVSPGSQHSFDTLKRRMGKVPNLYAVIGYSEYALEAFLTFEEILNKGVFNPKEREAIALVVSEVNGCEYCLAGHTLAAIKRGMTQAETLDARRGHMADPRLNAIVRLAKSIAENKGKPDPQILEAFYNTGFDEGAVMELIGFVTVRIYTNYVFAYSEIPIDFPMPEPV